MRYVFLLNPAAGRQDSTKELEAAARAALARAGVPAGQWSIRRTAYKGHARELARAAAAAGGEITLFAAGGDGTFNEVLTGAKGCPGAAVGCIPRRQRQRLPPHLRHKGRLPGPGRTAGGPAC